MPDGATGPSTVSHSTEGLLVDAEALRHQAEAVAAVANAVESNRVE